MKPDILNKNNNENQNMPDAAEKMNNDDVITDLSFTEEELLAQAMVVKNAERDEDGTTVRVFMNKYVKWALAAIAVAFAVYHIYLVFIKWTDQFGIFATHWAIGLALLFVYYPTKKGAIGRAKRFNPFDIACIVAVLVTWIYIMQDSTGLLERITYVQYSSQDLIFGIIAIFLTLEATRRSMGWGLPIVVACLMAYAFFGDKLPGGLVSKSYSLKRVVFNTFSLYGMFGTPIRMSCQNIFLLILFGAFLNVLGTGDTIMNVATSGFGGTRGGPAKVSVISSGLLGMISGSSVGNVVGTGVFTIPLMKKTGYRSEFAGAVEAVASTGGQIMPPVMGTAAFIMAELLGLRYAEICLAGLLPAVLYYFGLFMAVDLEAGRLNLKRMDVSKMERVGQILKEKWYHVLPIIALIVCLMLKLTIARAALWATGTMIVSAIVARDGKFTFSTFIKAMEMGTKNAMTIIACCACAGVAISVINLTGLGIKFTLIVTKLAGASLILSLVFAAIATIILGMGLPTSAAYIVVASVLVGALTKLGIAPLTAHMFLFYCASLAEITPPVAMAAYAAGNIAGAPPMKVGFTAMRLAACAFIMPFFIVYNPSLILQGAIIETIEAVITSFIGVHFMTVAFEGWLNGKINPINRVFLLVMSVLTIFPSLGTDIIGLIGILASMLVHKPMREKILGIFKKSSAA